MSNVALDIDWAKVPGVEIDPERQSGAPVFSGTRIPVNVVTSNIHNGGAKVEIAEILDNFDVSLEQIYLVLDQLQQGKPVGTTRS